MISNKILRYSSRLNHIYFNPSICNWTRNNSTVSKTFSSSENKSASKDRKANSAEYLADDMYNYTVYSYYDIEASMTKYRLPQPSSYAALKPEPAPQKK